jgi:hypothetical protein
MPNTANVNFQVTNLAQQVSTPSNGVSFVAGETVRGPFADPKDKINSWAAFVKTYGGLKDDSLFPLLCKRALDRGAILRVSRVGHYTDVTDASTLDAVKADLPAMVVLTFDAALITLNQIDMDINGDAITPVVFSVDNDTTLGLLATEIALHADVDKAEVISLTGDDTSIIIYPDNNAEVVITNPLVTLGASQAGITTVDKAGFVDAAGNLLFTIEPKFEGENYNNWVVSITTATNGGANYFDLSITNSVESGLDETYQNLTITGTPTVGESDYLNTLNTYSNNFTVTYYDLSSLLVAPRPTNSSLQFKDGDDGGTTLDTDYSGDSAAKTGIFAFDAYEDSYQLVIPHKNTTAIHTAGSAYAANRKDLVYWAHLDHLLDKTNLIAARTALNIDSKFTAFFSGGVKVLHPVTNDELLIPEVADLMANAALSDQNFGPWYSFAGYNRGVITNAIGLGGSNYGTPASFADLNDIANAQINMSVIKDSNIMLWGNFSGQLPNDPEKYLNIVRLIIYLQKSLKPTLERYIEEPNDIPTFKRIYYTVKPFLDSLLTNRAVFEYEWQGDQDATDLNSLQVNDPNDVSLGKYKVNFLIKPIASMQEISVNIIIAPAGVSFDIVSSELL